MSSLLHGLASAALTQELKKLAQQVVETDEGGEALTREQKLARMIWEQALGWVEKTRGDDGKVKEVYQPPVAWAQQFVFERIEGKAAQATPDESTGLRAKDKVAALARERVNKLAEAAEG